MIVDLYLRWFVTALFVVSAVECAVALSANRRAAVPAVGHGLHFVMAVAMAVMAWPRGAELPTFGPMIFFLLAAVWFVVVTAATAEHRVANAYHAAMMLAMAWMYAVMSNDLLPQSAGGHGGHQHGAPGANMADMADMADRATITTAPWWIAGLNWLCTVGFAVAALWWLYLYFATRRAEPGAPVTRFFGIACQAMMATGMAIMFGVTL